MGERLKFKTTTVTPLQERDGSTAYEATAEGVTYRIIGTPIHYGSARRTFHAFRVNDGSRVVAAGQGGEHRTKASAVQQCEADLDDVLRDRTLDDAQPNIIPGETCGERAERLKLNEKDAARVDTPDRPGAFVVDFDYGDGRVHAVWVTEINPTHRVLPQLDHKIFVKFLGRWVQLVRPVTGVDPRTVDDPATTDDTQELMDRVIRRAQYLALQAVLDRTRPSDRDAIGNIVNQAAPCRGTAQPYRVAP